MICNKRPLNDLSIISLLPIIHLLTYPLSQPPPPPPSPPTLHQEKNYITIVSNFPRGEHSSGEKLKTMVANSQKSRRKPFAPKTGCSVGSSVPSSDCAVVGNNVGGDHLVLIGDQKENGLFNRAHKKNVFTSKMYIFQSAFN